MEILKKEYFHDKSNKTAIKEENIGFLSDLNFVDSVLKATLYQAKANNNGTDENAHRNTFLFRLKFNIQIENC